jgi:glutathione reductase (NADPH)
VTGVTGVTGVTDGDPRDFDLDLFVIGGGSGGVRAARIAAGHGARVAIAEEYRWGGTCVIRGCIPKKLFVYASEMSSVFEEARGYGWRIGDVAFDWPTLLAAKDAEVARLSGHYRGNLERAGVRLIEGRARLVAPHTVEVAGVGRLRARVVLIATGSHPIRLEVAGAAALITSDEAFHLPALPRRLAVLGGGYIALELAHVFRGLGCEVTLIHRGTQVLRGFDDDVRDAAMVGLREHGIALVLGATIEQVERTAGGALELALAHGGLRVACDAALEAIGRAPSTGGIGLAEHGVALGPRGEVVVDDLSRSSTPWIYAVGDCTNRLMLTPLAIREGHAFADSVFGGRPTPIDHRDIPTAVFAQPPIAAIGLTETDARERLGLIEVYRASFRPLYHMLSGSPERVLMKLIVDAATRRVVGAHMVGTDAAEIIQALAVAIVAGITKEQLDATAALHPTVAEEWVLMRTPVA